MILILFSLLDSCCRINQVGFQKLALCVHQLEMRILDTLLLNQDLKVNPPQLIFSCQLSSGHFCRPPLSFVVWKVAAVPLAVELIGQHRGLD